MTGSGKTRSGGVSKPKGEKKPKGDRKGPEEKAKDFEVGTIKTGKDGEEWTVTERSGGKNKGKFLMWAKVKKPEEV